MIISFNQVQQYYGAQQVLSSVTFEIGEGERTGLIGRNGTGKTTVFQLMCGNLSPHSGQIFIRKGCRVGMLEQVPADKGGHSVYEVLAEAFHEVRQWQQQIRQLETSMSEPATAADEKKLAQLLDSYGKLLEQFQQAGGYEMEATINKVAAGLGIPNAQYDRLFSSLSGGEKTKVCLAALLLQKPDVLLLDEPTNHLDMRAIEWLETFLIAYPGTIAVISHDRYFLDKVAGKIIEIEDGEATTYLTNYTAYQKENEERLLRQFAEYQEQQKKIKKMQETIKQLIEWGNRANPPNPSFHRRAASMQKALDRMEKVRRPVLERRSIDLKLTSSDRSGKQVLVLDRVSKAYGERSLLKEASLLLSYGERISLIGNNGSGKSTLMKMILGQVPADGGELRIGSRVEIGYLAQEEQPPANRLTVLQFFREEAAMEEGRARGELARFLFYGADVFKRVDKLSGGEWSRLRLALLMFKEPNLLLLDEPTNHLDIDSREALEDTLLEFPGTVIAISHDRYFINRLAHKLWTLHQGELTEHIGNYDDFSRKQAARESVSRPSSEHSPGELSGANSRSHKEQSLSEIKNPEAARRAVGSTRVNAVRPHSGKAGSPPRQLTSEECELKIMEAEEKLKQLEIEMGGLSQSHIRDDWDALAEEYRELQNHLEELYKQWSDTETS